MASRTNSNRNKNINNITTDNKYEEYSILAEVMLKYLEDENNNDLSTKAVVTKYLKNIMEKITNYNLKHKTKTINKKSSLSMTNNEINTELSRIYNNSYNSTYSTILNNAIHTNKTQKQHKNNTKTTQQQHNNNTPFGMSNHTYKVLTQSLILKQTLNANKLKRESLAKRERERVRQLQERFINSQKL